jgi:ABC-type transporter Mla subunit MlaD
VALAIHDEGLTRRVGAAVLVVAALLVVFVIGVLDRLEGGGVDMRVCFGEATGLSEGAPVRVAGRTIGHVRKITIADRARDGRSGIVALIRLDRSWADRVPVNSDFFVDARAALAPRYVAIGPPPGHAAPARHVVDGDVVIGIDPPNLDRVLQTAFDNLTVLKQFLDALRPARRRLDEAVGRLTTTVRDLAPRPGAWDDLDRNLAGTIDEARAVMGDLRAGGVDPARLAQLAQHVDQVATRVMQAIDDLRGRIEQIRAAVAALGERRIAPELAGRIDRTLASVDRALAEASSLTEGVRGVVHDVTDGHGSAAAFAADLELIDDVKDLSKFLKSHPWRVMAPPSE